MGTMISKLVNLHMSGLCMCVFLAGKCLAFDMTSIGLTLILLVFTRMNGHTCVLYFTFLLILFFFFSFFVQRGEIKLTSFRATYPKVFGAFSEMLYWIHKSNKINHHQSISFSHFSLVALQFVLFPCQMLLSISQ